MVLFGKGCNMSDYIFGRNAVLEALESDRKVEKIYILKGDLKGSINKPMFYDIMIIFLIHKLGNYFYGNFATYATYCCT